MLLENASRSAVLAAIRTEPTTTVEVAGKALGLSRNSAYDAARRGEIPTLRFGRKLVVPTAAILQMLGLEAA